jgi:cytochrome c oxidase subunit 3
MALRSFRQREMKNYRLLTGLTVLLGIAFVVLQGFGFKELWEQQNITFKGVSGAGQFLYVIFGLHALHVIAGVIVFMVLFAKAFFSKTKVYSAIPIEVAATYWHFVDILWIYLLIFFIAIG